MMPKDLRVFHALNRRLAWDHQNLQVSADNLGRSGMPKQRAKVLSSFNLQKELSGKPRLDRIHGTHTKHMTGTLHQGPYAIKKPRRSPGEVTLTGNNIDEQKEMHASDQSNTNIIKLTTTEKALRSLVSKITGAGR